MLGMPVCFFSFFAFFFVLYSASHCRCPNDVVARWGCVGFSFLFLCPVFNMLHGVVRFLHKSSWQPGIFCARS